MQFYTLTVKNRAITLASDDDTLVRTSAGIDRIRIESEDMEWLDFTMRLALSHGGDIVQLLVLPVVSENSWYANFWIPDSVLETDGPIGVALHGTDSDGNHIITSYAAPLTVEHEGDVYIDTSIAEICDNLLGEYTKTVNEHSYSVSWDSFDGDTYEGFIVDTRGRTASVAVGMYEYSYCTVGLCSDQWLDGYMDTSSTRRMSSGTRSLTPTDEYPYVFVRISTPTRGGSGWATVGN